MLSVGRRYSKYLDKFAEELRSNSIFCAENESKIGVCDERWTDVFKKIKSSIKYKFITFDKL